MDDLQFVELSKSNVTQDVLHKFNCGHKDFEDFLCHDARTNAENGDGVTYILVSREECLSGTISYIFAFATIQTMAMYFTQTDKVYSTPAVEIKYFAIAKRYQKATACIQNSYKAYSMIFFEKLLIDLYVMSMSTIGFRAIFLRANKNGEKLYRRKFFVDADNYMIPYSDDDPLEQCVPLVLFVQENLYSVFGCE